jgi:hypothetical protein
VFYIDDSLTGISSLYGFLNSQSDESVRGLQLFTQICRVNPELVLAFTDRLSVDTSESRVEVFYITEVLSIILKEDRSGEINILCGGAINTALKACFESDIESQLMLNAQPLLQKTEMFASNILITDCVNTILNAEQEIRTASNPDDPPDIQLSNLGTLDIFMLDIVNIKSSVRVLNSWYSLHKWEFIAATRDGVLDALITLIVKLSQSLTMLVIDTMNIKAFDLRMRGDKIADLIDLILPSVDMISLLLSHLLGTGLKCYCNKALLTELINIYAICQHLEPSQMIRKTARAVQYCITLWGQFKYFFNIYFPVFLEHLFSLPYKQAPTFNLMSSLLECYVTYKEP